MGAIFKRGGIIPESYGLSLTVYPKTDVNAGQPVVFDKSAGDYGVAVAEAGVAADAIIKVGGKANEPVSCYVIGHSRNVKVEVNAVVAVGDKVAPAAGGIFAKADDGLLVLKGNADKTAEVLI